MSPAPPLPTAYLHDLGLISALGRGKAETGVRLATAPAARPAPLPWLDTPLPALAVAGELPPVPARLAAYDCRNNRLLLAALSEIEPGLAALRKRIAPERIGVVIGTSTSGIAEGEKAVAELHRSGRMPGHYHYKQQELGAAAEFLARLLDLRGPAFATSASCASGAHALAAARRLLRLGMCDLVLAGGADALCRTTLEGFAALESLSPGGCNPFSRNRDGITLGEGAALFLVGREPAPVALLGVGTGSDAHHFAAPRPDGAGALAAMRAALADAGLTPDQVDYINLHGTGTRQNDAMESRAVHALFGEATPCGSTKRLTGHCLGASGAIEAGLCWLLLADASGQAGPIPHRWDGAQDPELAPLNLAGSEPPGQKPGKKPLQYCLSNSYAFGGNNVSLLLGRP
jgi:3-oxoacyl-[acyl-carrier-protein] synthase-1